MNIKIGKRNLRLFIIALTVLILPSTELCASTFTDQISGYVIDENGNPIEYVNCVLTCAEDSMFIGGATTDATGKFSIINTGGRGDRLRLSCIGYEEVNRPINDYDLAHIVMRTTSHLLNDVTVTASKPMFYQDKGSLVTNVQGTVLGEMSSTDEVLAQIPGMARTPTGTLEVFGLGTPIIYINNQRIRSDSEIKQLNPKDIKNIQLISNPGAAYDAGSRAVLKITTIRRRDGLTMDMGGSFRQNKRSSFGGNISAGYRHKGLNIAANYDYDSYALQAFQPSGKELHFEGQTSTFIQDTDGDGREKEHAWALKTDYEINDCHIIGAAWNAYISRNHDARASEMEYLLDNINQEGSDILNDDVNKKHYNHINMFHSAKWNKRLTSDINLDYITHTNNYTQTSRETTGHAMRFSTFSGKSTSDIYAAKMVLTYQLSNAVNLTTGIDMNHVNNKGYMTSNSDIIPSSDYANSENKYAVYSELNVNVRKLSAGVGARYEFMQTSYTDHIDGNADLDRHYSNLYPSFSLSYEYKGWSNTLSLSSRTQRPSFRQLSAMNYYQNRYMYQHGNPLLTPSTSYILQWNTSYKFIYASLAYTHTKNYIANETYTSEYNGTTQIVSTYANRDKIRLFTASIILQKDISWWEPSLSAGINKQWFQSEYLGEIIEYNRPQYYVTLSQYFTLPKAIIVSAYYHFNSGGDQGSLRFRPYHTLNLSIQKSFLNKRLTLYLKANDIFHTMKFKVSEYRGNIHFWQTEDYKLWNYSISIAYRLNKKKRIKYRGDDAISADEIERLD